MRHVLADFYGHGLGPRWRRRANVNYWCSAHTHAHDVAAADLIYLGPGSETRAGGGGRDE